MSLATNRQSFNSFSGVNMQVVAGGYLIGEAQGVSFTTTREKAPIYTMGSADPRSFSRGKRGIAGSMVFMVFNASALLHSMRQQATYLANRYEVLTDIQAIHNQERDIGKELFVDANGAIDTRDTLGFDADGGLQPVGGYDFGSKVVAQARYHDQILPFDLILVAFNEYGHAAKMEIHNLEIMNCGSGVSVDDIQTDESCTFVATGIVPWYNQKYVDVRGTRAEMDPSFNPGRSQAGRA